MIGLNIGSEVEGDGQPEFRAIRMTKCFRHHADDSVGRVIQFDRLPKNVITSTEISLPEIVTDKHDAWTTGLVLCFSEIASEHRLKAENVQEVGGDACGREDLSRFARARDARGAAGGSTDSFENITAILAPLPNRLLR